MRLCSIHGRRWHSAGDDREEAIPVFSTSLFVIAPDGSGIIGLAGDVRVRSARQHLPVSPQVHQVKRIEDSMTNHLPGLEVSALHLDASDALGGWSVLAGDGRLWHLDLSVRLEADCRVCRASQIRWWSAPWHAGRSRCHRRNPCRALLAAYGFPVSDDCRPNHHLPHHLLLAPGWSELPRRRIDLPSVTGGEGCSGVVWLAWRDV